MRRTTWPGILGILMMVLLFGGTIHGQSDLCNTVDMKPVLSLQQINMAELVHYVVSIAPNLTPPDPEGLTPEEYYQIEVQMLIDAGYPPVFSEIEPDRLVTRRFFASLMFELAVATDDEFAKKYGDLTDETEQMQALITEEYLYAEEGKIYREEILSILCIKQPKIEEVEAMPLEIVPEEIKDATLESELSPI